MHKFNKGFTIGVLFSLVVWALFFRCVQCYMRSG